MDFWGFLAWLERTDVSLWVREGDLGTEMYLPIFYLLLIFHAVGMAMVVGISFMITARLFGLGRGFPLTSIHRFMNLAWWGFALNFVSGALLFIGQPRRELMTPAFDLKIIFVVLAGIAMVMTTRALRAAEAVPAGETATAGLLVPDRAKLASAVTSLLWLGAIVTGRVIAYTQPPLPPPTFLLPG